MKTGPFFCPECATSSLSLAGANLPSFRALPVRRLGPAHKKPKPLKPFFPSPILIMVPAVFPFRGLVLARFGALPP